MIKVGNTLLQRYIFTILPIFIMIFFTSCSYKRYVPVVKYSHPSKFALKTTLRQTHGDRYCYAGQGPHSFDCSGLIYHNYATMNLWLPRRAIDQSKIGKTIPISELRYGDLVFFDTHKPFRGKVNHAGIYIGGGLFTHASSAKRRVTTSRLNKPFYKNRIVVCKRVIPEKKKHIQKPIERSKPVKPRQPIRSTQQPQLTQEVETEKSEITTIKESTIDEGVVENQKIDLY